MRKAAKQLAREKLLDEGVALLMEHGYHGTGLQDILQRVGVPKGSFYNYFDSKEHYGAEAIRHYIEPFIEQLEAYRQRPDLSGVAALELYYREQIAEVGRRDFKGGCLLGNLIGEIGDTSETCRIALKSALDRYRDTLAALIAKGQAEGAYRQDRSAAEMADLLVNAWQGALLRMKIECSTVPLEQCVQALLGDHFRT